MELMFEGSYIDGPHVDLLDWAGLNLTPEQEEKVWRNHNPTSLLELCPCAEIEIDEQIEDASPGMNDTYYSVYAEDATTLKGELRELVEELIAR